MSSYEMLIYAYQITAPLNSSPRLFGDLQGKFPESFGGKRYSFPLVDDGSDFIIPTFLSVKSEATAVFKFVVNHLNNALNNRKVTFFRSYLGGEFVSNELLKFLTEHGVLDVSINKHFKSYLRNSFFE
jgi:hypothetical protein